MMLRKKIFSGVTAALLLIQLFPGGVSAQLGGATGGVPPKQFSPSPASAEGSLQPYGVGAGVSSAGGALINHYTTPPLSAGLYEYNVNAAVSSSVASFKGAASLKPITNASGDLLSTASTDSGNGIFILADGYVLDGIPYVVTQGFFTTHSTPCDVSSASSFSCSFESGTSIQFKVITPPHGPDEASGVGATGPNGATGQTGPGGTPPGGGVAAKSANDLVAAEVENELKNEFERLALHKLDIPAPIWTTQLQDIPLLDIVMGSKTAKGELCDELKALFTGLITDIRNSGLDNADAVANKLVADVSADICNAARFAQALASAFGVQENGGGDLQNEVRSLMQLIIVLDVQAANVDGIAVGIKNIANDLVSNSHRLDFDYLREKKRKLIDQLSAAASAYNGLKALLKNLLRLGLELPPEQGPGFWESLKTLPQRIKDATIESKTRGVAERVQNMLWEDIQNGTHNAEDYLHKL